MSNPVAPPAGKLSGLAEGFCRTLPSTGALVPSLHILAARVAGQGRGA